MIEIFILISVYRALARRAEEKGRSRAFGWLGVGLWIIGEILGVVIGVAAGRSGLSVYLFALPGALLGLGLAWFAVSRLDQVESVDARTFD